MSKIGIFDSGRGGEFVVNELQKLRPGDEFVVVNDSKSVPYGNKKPDEILQLTKNAILPILNCDLIVIACNTATVYAINELRKTYPEKKFVGFEPMIKFAGEKITNDDILILATNATLKSQKYNELKETYTNNKNIIEPDCSSWAEKIENGTFTNSDITRVKEFALSKTSDNKIEQVIIACTHYLGIKNELQNAFPNANIHDPVLFVNRQIDNLLK